MIVLLRAIILYLLIVISLRLMGKRQLGELQPSELVITILISNIAAIPIEDPKIPMATGIIPIVVLVSFELIVSTLSLHSKRFRNLISGKPVVVIKNGRIDKNAMKKLRFSIDDLMESLRGNGIFDVDEVAFAVVETTGSVSVLEKTKNTPVTLKILENKRLEASPPLILISDGVIMESSLEELSLTKDWLLKKLGDKNPKDVFLMTCDRDKNIKIY